MESVERYTLPMLCRPEIIDPYANHSVSQRNITNDDVSPNSSMYSYPNNVDGNVPTFVSDEVAMLKLQDMLHNILGNIVAGTFVVDSIVEGTSDVVWKVCYRSGTMYLRVLFEQESEQDLMAGCDGSFARHDDTDEFGTNDETPNDENVTVKQEFVSVNPFGATWNSNVGDGAQYANGLAVAQNDATNEIHKFLLQYSQVVGGGNSKKKTHDDGNALGPNALYGCPYCDKIFPTHKMLKLHVAVHLGKKLYVCTVCSKGYSLPSNLRRHMYKHKGTRPHRCHTCCRRFSHHKLLVAHRYVHSEEKRYECELCGSKFKFKSQHRKHLLQHMQKNGIKKSKNASKADKILKTEKTTRSISTLKIDDASAKTKKIKSIGKTRMCLKCKVVFSNSSVLRLHKCKWAMQRLARQRKPNAIKQEPQVDDDPNPCARAEVCLKSEFPLLVPVQEFSCVCTICMKSFSTAEELEMHVFDHKDSRPYSCSYCPRTFSTLYSVKRHERIHSGEKPFQCRFCNRAFARDDKMKLHERRHNKGVMWCNKCTASFSQHQQLEQHMARCHPARRPFFCTTCRFTCQTHPEYVAHVQQHTTKVHQCAICQRPFRDVHNLQRHMRIHSGEKPYACERCDKRFARMDKLRDHERTHKASFGCSVCGECFSTKHELLLHVPICRGKYESAFNAPMPHPSVCFVPLANPGGMFHPQ